MSVPKLRFKEFKGKWEVKKIEDVTSYVDYRGKTPTKTKEGILLVTAKNIRFGYIDYEISKEYIAEKDYNNVMRRGKPVIGDVLITTEAPLGNIATVDREHIALAQRVIKLRGNKGVMINAFLKYKLLSPGFQNILSTKATGCTAKGIKGSILHKIEIAFPTEREQTKIANFLTTIDEKIAQLTRKYELLARYKKGVMQQLFSQELRFKDEGDRDFPEWEVYKLIDVASINPKSTKLPDSFIYIDLESVKDGYLLFENRVELKTAPSRAQRLLQKNDILYQTVRPYQKNNLLFDKDGDYVASTGYAQIRTNQNTNFIFQLLYSDDFVNDVLSRCTGTSYPAIDSTSLSEIQINIPNIKEQTKIAIFLTAIDEKITQTQTYLETVKRYKQGLLQQMFI